MKIGYVGAGPLRKERIDRSISLYKSREISKIIFSSFTAEEIKHAVEKGVNENDLLVEAAADTLEELYLCKRALKFYDVSEVYLISAWWHLPRIRLLAKGILKEYRIKPIPVYGYETKKEILKYVGLEILKTLVDLGSFACRREDVYKKTLQRMKKLFRRIK